MFGCADSIVEGPRVYGRTTYKIFKSFPMMGHIAFGVIERGSNVIQVRPSTLCFHDCIFCSVDAGPSSRRRASEYIVSDVEWLAEWAGSVAEAKGGDVEALIDGVGEPLTNPKILDLIRLLKSKKGIRRVAIETHGGSLSVELGKRLYEAGLDRINLSIDALDSNLARRLAGVQWYDVDRIIKVVKELMEETNLDVILTPVIVPGYNEGELAKIARLAKELGLGVRSGWPTGVLAQKYEEHKYGRRPPRVRPWTWREFYNYLKKVELEIGYRLTPSAEEVGFTRRPRVERPFKVGETVNLLVVANGWLKGEILGVDPDCYRVFSIVGARISLGARLKARVVKNDNNIYIAKPFD